MHWIYLKSIGEINMSKYDKVVELLEKTPSLSDYSDDTVWLADMVNQILYDKDDDKLGRIKDLYNKHHDKLADWVEENWDVSNTANWILREAENV